MVHAGATLVLGDGCIRTRSRSRESRRAAQGAESSTRASTRASRSVHRRVPATQLRARREAARGLSRRARRAAVAARPPRSGFRAACSRRRGPADASGRRPQPRGHGGAGESLPEIVAGRDRCRASSRSSMTRTPPGCSRRSCRRAMRWCSPAVTIPGRCRLRRSQSLTRQLGGPPAEVVRDPRGARRACPRAGRPRRRRPRDRLAVPGRRPGRPGAGSRPRSTL